MLTQVRLASEISTREEACRWVRVVSRATGRPVTGPVRLVGGVNDNDAAPGRWAIRVRHRPNDLAWIWVVLACEDALSIQPADLVKRLQQAARNPQQRTARRATRAIRGRNSPGSENNSRS